MVTSGSSRYVIPGDVMLVLAASLAQAFDGLKFAALALQEENTASTVTSLQYLHARLSLIHETLLAVVGENGENDGSPRAC